MWKIEGEIQQVHETNEPDTIAACLKLQHKSKSERCTQAWSALLKYSYIHLNEAPLLAEALMEKPLHHNVLSCVASPLKLSSEQSDHYKTSLLVVRTPPRKNNSTK
jgi:hypothetical protein